VGQNVRIYRDFLVEKRTILGQLKSRLSECENSLVRCKDRLSVLSEAQEIVNAVTVLTLQEVKVFVEEAVSLCLAVVYGQEYRFQIDYQVKRGRSEAAVYIVKSGEKLDPRSEVGGGVVDVASIGLRLVIWMLMVPRSDPLFVFDEPFRFVSRDLTHKVVDLLKEICNTFGAQVLMVSHNDELIEEADKTIQVEMVNGVSKVSDVS